MHRLLALVMLFTPFISSLRAATIDYTITGMMDGFIQTCSKCLAEGFTDKAFTFEFTADTAGVFDIAPGVLGNPVLSSSITIDGGTGAFTEGLDVFDLPLAGRAGFTDLAFANGIPVSNTALDGWDLATSIGPISNTASSIASTQTFDTSLGTLTDSNAFDLKFQASVVTPEPAHTSFAALLLVLALGLRRKMARVLARVRCPFSRTPLLALALTVLVAPLALAHAYTFTTLDYPADPGTTILTKIDDLGRILGSYGPGNVSSGPVYGFLYDHGKFSAINFPGATQTFPSDINLFGEIVGDINESSDGFVLQFGKYSQVDDPGNVGTTVLNGVNFLGQMVGFTYKDPDSAPYYTGFLLNFGTFTTLPQYPGSVGTLAFRINIFGDILGAYVPAFTGDFEPSPYHGFLYKHGKFIDLEDPLQGTTNCDTVLNPYDYEYCSTSPLDFNDQGDIVGWYTANDGSAHGFLLKEGVWTTIDFPDATSTEIQSINFEGDMVGAYTDSMGALHGFLATPY
jgi:hypothetical protein